MAKDRTTPEQHTTQLLAELEYALDNYGPRSLAAVIATILENTENGPSAWARYAPMFRRIEERD